MSRDGSGNYSLPAGNPVSTGTTISSTWANNTLSDIATALTQSISKDGQTTYTANQPMGGNKHTSIANASARDQYAAFGQVQDGAAQYLTTVAGTNTITASLNSLAAYAAGQRFAFIAANTNTGAVTININGLGARDITKQGTTALVSGDIPAGIVVNIVYDGTRFQMQGFPATLTLTGLTVSGTASFASGTWSSTGLSLNSSTTNSPTIVLENTTTDANSASVALFKSRGGLATNNGDSLALFLGYGRDAANASRLAGYLRMNQNGAAGASWVAGQFLLNVTSVTGVDTNIVNATAAAVNVPVPLQENATRVFSRNSAFVSSEQTITASTSVTVAHGLAGVPAMVRLVLRCKTAELGYLVGEEVDVTTQYTFGGGQVQTSADATNVYITLGNNVNLLNKLSMPNVALITYGNWRWVVRAWY
jgi:hypothetical protein